MGSGLGGGVQEIAPNIYDRVPARARSTHTVRNAVDGGVWAEDIGPDLSTNLLREFLELWTRVGEVQLTSGCQDKITWAWDNNGEFSARSAYTTKFWGRQKAPTAEFTWKSRAPLQCRFFTWLALRDRCWTSDRLAKRGLPHQDSCPLCAQQDETISHILPDCVFAKEIWMIIFTVLGQLARAPSAGLTLKDWCTTESMTGIKPQDQKAIFTLVMWTVWKPCDDEDRQGRKSVEAGGLLKGDLNHFFGSLARWVVARE